MIQLADQNLFTFIEKNLNLERPSAKLTSALYSIIFSDVHHYDSQLHQVSQSKRSDESDIKVRKKSETLTKTSSPCSSEFEFVDWVVDRCVESSDSHNNIKDTDNANVINYRDNTVNDRICSDDNENIDVDSLEDVNIITDCFNHSVRITLKSSSNHGLESDTCSRRSSLKNPTSGFVELETSCHNQPCDKQSSLSASISTGKPNLDKINYKESVTCSNSVSGHINEFNDNINNKLVHFNSQQDFNHKTFDRNQSRRGSLTNKTSQLQLQKHNNQSTFYDQSNISSSNSSLVSIALDDPTDFDQTKSNVSVRDESDTDSDKTSWILLENDIDQELLKEEAKDNQKQILPVQAHDNGYNLLYRSRDTDSQHKKIETDLTINRRHCDIMALTRAEIELIKASWEPVRRDVEDHGLQFFKDLFTKFPTYLQFFNQFDGLDLEKMHENRRLTRHATKVMDTVTFVVDSVGDSNKTDELNDALIGLVNSHLKRKIGYTEFHNLGIVLVDFICNINNSRGSAKDRAQHRPQGTNTIDHNRDDRTAPMTEALDKLRSSPMKSPSLADHSIDSNVDIYDCDKTKAPSSFATDSTNSSWLKNSSSATERAPLDTNSLVAAWLRLYASILDLVKREEKS